MLQPYPLSDQSKVDPDAVKTIEWLKQMVIAVRTIRGEMNIPPGKPIPLYIKNLDKEFTGQLANCEYLLRKLAKLENVAPMSTNDTQAVASQLVGELELCVPMADLINKDDEIARLQKEISRAEKEIARLEGKLSNAKFTERAPAEVVTKERDKLDELKSALLKLQAQLTNIESL